MRIPSSITKKFIEIIIKGAFIEISFHFTPSSNRFSKLRFLYKLRDFVYGCTLKIKKDLIFDANLYSEDFHVKIDGTFVQNKDLSKILNINIGTMKNLVIIVPNRFNITSGKHKINLNSVAPKFNFVFKSEVLTSTEEVGFNTEQNFEKIIQQPESLAIYQQDAREFQSKIAKRAFQIVLLVYIPTVLIMFGFILIILLDPAASQTDAGLGPGITLIFLICIGICLLPNFKRKVSGRIKGEVDS